MRALRTAASVVLSRGVISAGWYAILTGVAMLFVAWALASVGGQDPAAPVVAVVLAVTGVWQLERGLRAEFQRRQH
jgi:DMSO reductase anchor subunit